MAAPAGSTPSKWTGCAMQHEISNERLNVFWRCAMRLPPRMRFSIAMTLVRLSGRCADWAVTLDPQTFEKIKALAMRRSFD